MTDRAALRGLAHAALRSETGATAVLRLCARCGSAGHGRPLARTGSGSSPAVSLSYAGELAAVAWSWTGPAGIDIEEAGPPLDGIDRQEWTLVEAAYKAGDETTATALELPAGYLGAVAGAGVSWRLVGPAAPSR